MNKEAIIICESMYNGNTIKLAKAMAFSLNCEIANAQEKNVDYSINHQYEDIT